MITITVSEGPPTFSVPDVTNFKFTTAQSRIREANLKSKIITEYHDIVDTGSVIRQSPIAGTKLKKKNEEVTIYVSNGKKRKRGVCSQD